MTAKCYLHQCFRNLAVSLLASSVARNSQPTSRCAKYPLTALTAEIPPATEYALMDPCCTWGNRQFGPITTVRETATFSLIPAVFPRDYSSKRPPLFFGIADHGDTHRPLSLRAPGLDLMKGVTSAPRNPNRGKTKEKNPPPPASTAWGGSPVAASDGWCPQRGHRKEQTKKRLMPLRFYRPLPRVVRFSRVIFM